VLCNGCRSGNRARRQATELFPAGSVISVISPKVGYKTHPIETVQHPRNPMRLQCDYNEKQGASCNA